ncbi:MAG: PilX N-terminal domain-containing pilus assembly protein [Thermodesulfobacteriota bacterium]
MKHPENRAGGMRGSALMVTMLVMMALLLTAVMAVNMAMSDSSIMRNNRLYRDALYRAETGITLARETHADSWLAPDSELFDLSREDAAVTVNGFSVSGPDGNDLPAMGNYSIARIERDPEDESLSKQFYALGHRAPMPSGAGYSARSFEIRRYGVLSNGLSRPDRPAGGVTVEAGLYKVFNAF